MTKNRKSFNWATPFAELAKTTTAGRMDQAIEILESFVKTLESKLDHQPVICFNRSRNNELIRLIDIFNCAIEALDEVETEKFLTS